MISSFLILFTGLMFDPLNVQVTKRKLHNESESMVIGRLVKSRTDGIFSAGGLTGRCKDQAPDADPLAYQYEAFEKGYSCNNFSPYLSQIGFHAVIYGLIDKASPFSSRVNLVLMRIFKVSMLSMVMSLVIYWFFLEFGILSALFALLGMLLTPWITYLGKDLWFCIWSNFLPFMTALFLLKGKSEGKKISWAQVLLLVNLGILANFVINGYEWVSTTLVMATTPFFYYGIKDRWPVRKLLGRLVWMVAGSVASLMLTFAALAYQISLVKGKFSDGIQWIIFSFHKRSFGTIEGLPEVYANQIDHPLQKVFLKYFMAPAFKFPVFITPHTPWYLDGIFFIELIFVFALATGLIFLHRTIYKRTGVFLQNLKSLAMTTWISILAPFSWLIIFKGHAWSHAHINYITWFMPFCIFGMALIGATVSAYFRRKAE